MGARSGSAKRFEEPYTLKIETPHVKWAKPLPGGPVHLLAVPSVHEGRTLVELAERLSLDLTTVSIDQDWDVNKWTMAFGEDYGARAEKGDLKLVYSYVEQELTGPKKFDAILLPLNHGWNALTPASREALKRRVREGCGLVLIRPYADDITPLVPVDLQVPDTEFEEPKAAGRTEASPWRRTRDHYITRPIPVETFPFGDVENFVYTASPGADVLISTESGHPVLATMPYGKGRVVAFAYRNQGLSWQMPMEARGHFVDASWEYFYAMLVRSIIYAAGREGNPVRDFNAPGAVWRLRDAYNHVVQSGRGRAPQSFAIAAGRYFLEQQLAADWKITPVNIGQPPAIEDLAAEPAIIGEGGAVTVRWRAPETARIELVDGFERVIANADGKDTVSLIAGRPLTHSGFVRATIGTTIKQTPVRFIASSREWNDYEVMLPWFGPKSYQPWIPAVDEQFRRIGITTLANPERNFKMMVSAHLPGFGIYWYRRDAYLKRKEEFLKTGDKKYLTREVTLESPAFERGIRAQLDKSLRPLAPLKPMACYLADESSLTFYSDAFDVDWAPESLAGLRQWLRGEYGSLDVLNESWGTSFSDWDSVVPMTTSEAQKHGNYAAWADHRAYMETQFVRAFGKARELVHEIDPGARASVSGTQVPGAHNGCNWSRIDQEVDYLQPYSDGDQDPMHYLFRPGLTITGFTGYGLVGDEAQHAQWRRLFYGHSGASIFWHYTLLNPDLTMSAQGTALASAFGRLQSGIARVFMNSTVHEDGIAIHFSMPSIRGAWITDGKIVAGEHGSEGKTSANFGELQRRRDAWVKSLEADGVQFRFLATEHIEAGMLDRYKVLILPYSIAITDQEAQAIERFMSHGGIVYGDDQTGRMDGRCHWRKQPLWSKQTSGFMRSGPSDVGVKHDFGGRYLVTVRDFGSSRLTGVLPEKPTTVQPGESAAIRYDLLRGGLAGSKIEAGPDKPVLLVERKSRIASLAIGKDLRISLRDENGAPVDLSVVRVEVFDPAGRLVRPYTANVTVRDGGGAFEIPFALSDASGAWRVHARDVVSGLIADTTVNRGALSLADMRPVDAHAHIFVDHPALHEVLKRLNLTFIDINVIDPWDRGYEGIEPQHTNALAVSRANSGRAPWVATFDAAQFESPGFADRVIRQLGKNFEEGAVGVKIYKTIGMEIQSKAGRYVMPDDPAFAPILDAIAARNKTLYAHIAEPAGAWKPLDPADPDTSYYRDNPHWSMYGKAGKPSKQTILEARDRMLAAHPKLRVIGAHLGSMEEDVDQIAKRLDRYPNLAVDTAARVTHLALQPREKVRAFLIKYQDRVLYATDDGWIPGDNVPERVKQWERDLQRDWKYFATTDDVEYMGRGIKGLGLPEPVLRKLYRGNAIRWVPGIGAE